jgi:phosphate transport system substrate-binding protein
MRMRGIRSAVIVATVAVVGAACSSDSSSSGSGSGGAPLTGSINISGSSTVLPISQLVTEEFHASNPDVQTSVDGPGTGDGFVLFCDGKTDISDASRPIEDDEKKACEKGGVKFVELKVGLDGITVMTNPANSAVTCLNDGDLYALFGPQSEGIDTWSGADSLANEVGGTGNFPDLPLAITAPGEESGTYDAFIELAGIEDMALSQGVSEDDAATLRPDYQSSPNDNVIIQAMENDQSGLGFVGFAYADQQGESIKKLQIDGGDGCVEPSADTIADGSYPLSRSLYIYVNTDKVASSPALKAFVDFYLSDEGIQAVVDSDYVAIPQDQLDATRQAWASASS